MPWENRREQAKRERSPGEIIASPVLLKKKKKVQEFYLQSRQLGIVIKNSFGQFLYMVVIQEPANK